MYADGYGSSDGSYDIYHLAFKNGVKNIIDYGDILHLLTKESIKYSIDIAWIADGCYISDMLVSYIRVFEPLELASWDIQYDENNELYAHSCFVKERGDTYDDRRRTICDFTKGYQVIEFVIPDWDDNCETYKPLR